MLVLTRQRDETVMIGDQIEVTIVDIRGDKVRVGINAPKAVAVHRKEVYETIRRENQHAAELQPADLTGLPPISAAGRSSPLSIKAAAIAPVAAPFPRLANPSPDPFMQAALEEARQGLAEGGLPIGSVLVRGNQIIGRGHNRRVQRGDPMAHAEIDCLSKAGRQRTYRDTTLYSTLMPCYLCGGAAVQFSIPRIVVGESLNFAGSPDFMRQRGISVIDLQDSECIELMSRFIADHPELWNEDIGK